jgi:dTDP-4-dehydrorhamnose reductase
MERESPHVGRLKVLVTGGAGLVAGAVLASTPDDVDVEVTWRMSPPPAGAPAHRVELDHADAVRALLEEVAPEVVVHTAYTAERRADIVAATANVAAACSTTGAALVHLSSDVVFDGRSAPYVESDPFGPVNDYGRWKADAEIAALAAVPDVCITRTSLVVSLDPPDKGTRWLLDAVGSGGTPTLFHDEIRSAITVADVATAIWWLVTLGRSERAGVWHLPGPEALSRLELGRRLLVAAGYDPELARSASGRDHPTPRASDLTLATERRRTWGEPSPVP